MPKEQHDLIKTTTYAKEIAAIIALKIFLLTVLWFGIFAPAERPPVDAKVISDHWLSTTESHPPASSPERNTR